MQEARNKAIMSPYSSQTTHYGSQQQEASAMGQQRQRQQTQQQQGQRQEQAEEAARAREAAADARWQRLPDEKVEQTIFDQQM